MLAQAGIQAAVGRKLKNLDSRVRGNDHKQKVDFKSTLLISLGLWPRVI